MFGNNLRQIFEGTAPAVPKVFRAGRSTTLQENSPTKVVAQVFRHQLRTKVRSMICPCCVINIHATGFS